MLAQHVRTTCSTRYSVHFHLLAAHTHTCLHNTYVPLAALAVLSSDGLEQTVAAATKAGWEQGREQEWLSVH